MHHDTTYISFFWGAPEFLGAYHVLFSLSLSFSISSNKIIIIIVRGGFFSVHCDTTYISFFWGAPEFLGAYHVLFSLSLSFSMWILCCWYK